MITASYNRFGYWIYSGDEVVYAAGNHALDSTISTNDQRVMLPLRAIRSCAIRTARELAAERGEQYVGVAREADHG